MSEHQSSYRQIAKATSIFGGLQVYQILLSVIRSKFVAVLLGTQGMGISGLLTSVTTLITSLTSLGLGMSAVRNVSDANASGDTQLMAEVVTTLRKLVWITGILGGLLTFVFASTLSQFSFGNHDFVWAFRWLSVTFLLAGISSGQFVMLQGMRKLKELAGANALGATLGLLVSIPLYYRYGTQGIVPALVVTSVTSLLLALYFGRKIKVENVKLPLSLMWTHGKEMIRMGFLFSLSGLIAATAAYLIRMYIGQHGTLADVGLYTAGFAIINTYVGMIFTAMSTDYYPRLSAVAQHSEKVNLLVNQQLEMAILALGPFLIFFMITLKYAVIILYSSEFLDVIPMVQWAVIAIFFKALTWGMGFLLLAKGASQFFFYNELIANSYTLVLNIAGYHWYGLEGLGISFLVSYLLSVAQNFILLKYLYQFSFSIYLYKLFIIQMISASFCFLLIRNMGDNNWIYFITILILFLISFFSYIELNKKINLSGHISKLFSKRQP